MLCGEYKNIVLCSVSGDGANTLDASPQQQQQQQSVSEASTNPIIVNAIVGLTVVSGFNLVLVIIIAVRCLCHRRPRRDVVDILDDQWTQHCKHQ